MEANNLGSDFKPTVSYENFELTRKIIIPLSHGILMIFNLIA